MAAITPLPFAGRAARRRRHPSRAVVALRARWYASTLDLQLAAGVSPSSSPELEARARLLEAPRERAAVAAGLERIAARAARDRGSLSAAVPLRRGLVGPATSELLALAAELRTARRPPALGVALARRLLTDVAGPLYDAADAYALVESVRVARAALADPER